MPSRKLSCFTLAALMCLVVSGSGLEKKSKDAKTEDAKPSYELPQPVAENLDYSMYQRIRNEGLLHSHVMEFASALADGIGPRLTGSPNLKRAN
ncbi:MAG TPA: peptidase M28, partial [Candidatus Sulfotelmatobacter sp.]